ncbi:MAG: transcriptional repressor, partial [Clostridia bacterium]
SLGTVYRNLAKLVESGDIIKVQGVFEKDRYDGNAVRHAHLVCSKCGRVVDFDIPRELDNQILKVTGKEVVVDYALTYYGLCEQCSEQAKNSDTQK